ncbi:MAG: hypothetical protein HC873_06835 [Leptolyngbyaceae cyanobacterium SL_1_1]|nr:hypothetical protein [Leptolyngbyaceae cyanobacterium RM1_1_2]NJO09408.1 hypothetical protein [Leptolyngbyaceae cyanobacterium SL_1_1]
MSTANVLQFMQKTADDAALRQQLEELLGVGDGDISSESELDPQETAALKGERAPIVTEFAAKHGYSFLVSELVAVVDAFEKHQAGTLSDSEFTKMLGDSDQTSQNAGSIKRLANYFTRTYLGYDMSSK